MKYPVLGIDPGVRGGAALLHSDGTPWYVWAFSPTMTHKILVDVVVSAATLLDDVGGRHCFIEKVGYMPTDGGKGANTFGRVDGLLRGAALALGLHVHDVQPYMWQTALECLSGGNKNVTKRRALELYPQERITHATADALLIARFGWLQLQQDQFA